MVPISGLSLFGFFDLVRKIPYRQDSDSTEVLARPRIILDFADAGQGQDCKKKALLLAAYLQRNNIPWRLVATSRRLDGKVHHIYVQAYLDGAWKNLDATYPEYKPFEPKTVTRAEVI
jgi:transglutaminase-like putative cysteine protease